MIQRMSSHADLDDLTKQLVAWANDQQEVDALYLFGSQVSGHTHAASDVDIAVLVRQDIASQALWRLEDRWSATWPELLDIRVLNLAPVAAQFEVITTGHRLWQRSLDRVAEYESWIRRRYWDLEPVLERDWQAFVQRLWEQRDDAKRKEYQAALAQIRIVHRRVRETAASHAR